MADRANIDGRASVPRPHGPSLSNVRRLKPNHEPSVTRPTTVESSGAPLHLSTSIAPYEDKVPDARASVSRDEDFEALYRAHAERVWRGVYAYAQDGEVASDAVAEAFTQCLARGSAVRDPERWLWRAAFRIAAGMLKDRRRTIVAGGHVAHDMNQTQELLDALRQISPRQRAALVLHYYAGYSAREIAAIVASTPATVRVHLSQGRKRLRRVLQEADE